MEDYCNPDVYTVCVIKGLIKSCRSPWLGSSPGILNCTLQRSQRSQDNFFLNSTSFRSYLINTRVLNLVAIFFPFQIVMVAENGHILMDAFGSRKEPIGQCEWRQRAWGGEGLWAAEKGWVCHSLLGFEHRNLNFILSS